MSNDEYDRLLAEIRKARGYVADAMSTLQEEQEDLERLLDRLDEEDSRIARQALTSMHSASRKLVVGE